MSRDLNAEFAGMLNGDMSFLIKRPVEINPQTFGFVKGDKETFNPLMGMTVQHRTNVGEVLKHRHVDPTKDKVIANKSVTVYADWNFAADKTSARKSLVSPTVHLVNLGGYCQKIYYLPWREDRRHTMTISDEADFFMTASMHGCRFEVRDFGNGMLSTSHSNIQPGSAPDPQAALSDLARIDTALAPTVLSFGKDCYFADAVCQLAAAKHGLIPIGIGPHEVISADPGGYLANVVGARQGGQWRFYYQLAGTLKVNLLGSTSKKKWLGLFGHKTIQTKHQIEYDLVLLVKEIWPGNSTIYQR